MAFKSISILGSTGSVGTQALSVVDALGDIRVAGLAAGENTALLERQIRKYKPLFASVASEGAAARLKAAVADTDTTVLCGAEGLRQIATLDAAQAVLTATVGTSGLLPTLAAIGAKKDILLANKETLVAAGDIIIKEARRQGVNIIPVDSEHSAIFQCLQGGGAAKRLILTASGGAFYDKSRAFLEGATVQSALRHPSWSMGRKITIDSATLMNKGLEVIEAHHLFDMPYEKIEVVIHRESIVHSMVEFSDNSVLAQMGTADMRLPIQYALCYPRRGAAVVQGLDFSALSLSFSKADTETFRLLPLAIEAGKKGGTAPAALNAANEAAVALFLKGVIRFLDIEYIVGDCLASHRFIKKPAIQDIIALDTQIKSEIMLRYGSGTEDI